MRTKVMAVAAALLAVVGSVQWARSYFVRDRVDFAWASPSVTVYSYLGGLHFLIVTEWPWNEGFRFDSVNLREEASALRWQPEWDDQYPLPHEKKQWLGFGYICGYYNLTPEKNGLPVMPYRAVVVPFWFLVLLTTFVFMPLTYRCVRRNSKKRSGAPA